MKYLHDTALAEITALLSDCPVWASSTTDHGSGSGGGSNSSSSNSTSTSSGGSTANSRTLHGRLEAYTTKRAGTDKKYAVNVSDRYIAEQESVTSAFAVDDTKLAALIQFQKEQIQQQQQLNQGGRRKRRSASTGEVPLEIQKSRRLQLTNSTATTTTGIGNVSSSIVGSGKQQQEQKQQRQRGRANSLDIPRFNSNAKLTQQQQNEEDGGRVKSTGSVPSNQPNFRALSMAPVNRRLLTDLILTLNHSFPDYDFTSAGMTDFTVCSVQTAVTKINERLGEFSAATSSSSSMIHPSLSLIRSFLASSTASGDGADSANVYNGSTFLTTLWKAIDNVIHLSEVNEVYSYQPSNSDEMDDPHSFLKNSLVKGGWEDYSCNDVVGSYGLGINTRGGGIHTENDSGTDYDDDLDDSYNSDRNQSHRTRGGTIVVHREVLWTFNYMFVNKHAKRILLFTCIETMTRSGYSLPTIVPSPSSRVHSNYKNRHHYGTIGSFNAIPEHETIHHELRDHDESNSLMTPSTDYKRTNQRRRYKHWRQSSPSILPSDEDNENNYDDDDDDDDHDEDYENDDDDDEEDDDSHTIASSSAVSVDFDLDPAHAVSGGIPIG